MWKEISHIYYISLGILAGVLIRAKAHPHRAFFLRVERWRNENWIRDHAAIKIQAIYLYIFFFNRYNLEVWCWRQIITLLSGQYLRRHLSGSKRGIFPHVPLLIQGTCKMPYNLNLKNPNNGRARFYNVSNHFDLRWWLVRGFTFPEINLLMVLIWFTKWHHFSLFFDIHRSDRKLRIVLFRNNWTRGYFDFVLDNWITIS